MAAKITRILNYSGTILTVVVVCFILCCRPSCGQASTVARTKISFKGTATGGTLLIGDTQNPQFVRYYSINTIVGESAESVVKRMAKEIVSSDTIIKFGRSGTQSLDDIASKFASGSTLIITGGPKWCLAGTETGFEIPKAPLFLSCSYNKATQKLNVKWVNQEGVGKNDIIKIRWRYQLPNGKENRGSTLLPGSSTSFTIDRPTDVKTLLMDVWLMVIRYDNPSNISSSLIPSNITSIYITDNGYCQQELEGIPFTDGIAPNWTIWSNASKIDKKSFEQFERTKEMRNDSSGLRTIFKFIPFYQIIKAPAKGSSHGIYRKFLGLNPGHTYRLTACISTLDMDSIKNDWSFSMHAVPGKSGGKDLTARQMAGADSLPDGKQGLKAAQFASHGPTKTTKKDFDLDVTGTSKLDDGSTSSDITLSPDQDEITIWLRFKCDDPNGKVGFSGMQIEDITSIQGF
jgi:hypothetical protein